MGIRGAALASFIAEVSGSIFFIIYAIRKTGIEKYLLFKISPWSGKLLKSISLISIPMMIQYFVSLGGWFIFFLFVEKMGEHNLAISNIIRNAYVFLLIPVWGFASASNTLVSNTIGKGNIEEVLHLMYKVVGFCSLILVVMVGISLVITEPIITIFTNDASLILDSIPVFQGVAAAAIFVGAGITIFNAVSGTGKTIVALFIEVSVIIFYLTFVYFVSRIPNIDINIVWTSEYIYGILIAIISLIYMRYGNWKSENI